MYLAGVLQAPNGAAELINPIRPIKQGNLKQQPPSTKKRAFQVVVDDEIEFSDLEIAAQLVRLVLLQLLRRSLRTILSDCRCIATTSSEPAGSDPFVPDLPTAPHLLAEPLAIFA